MKQLWQYKTMVFDRDDGTVFWDESSRWFKLDELDCMEWELCQIVGPSECDTAWAIFKREAKAQPVASRPLKPCPFCGADNTLKLHSEPLGSSGQTGLYFVECTRCDTRGPGAAVYGEIAIEKWNKRAEVER